MEESSSISTNDLKVQLSLFALDPWGAEHAFAVFDRPHPGIARAMMGPLCLGQEIDPADESLKCLAVTEDCTFAACTRVSSSQLKNPMALWQRVARELDAAHQHPVPVNLRWASEVPPDCVERWSDLAFWIPRPHHWDPVHRSIGAMAKLLENQLCGAKESSEGQLLANAQHPRIEIDVHGTLERQVVSAVLDVCGALNPRLRDAVIGRPRMSLSMAYRLTFLAGTHGRNAQSYVSQALNTESLAVLHLAASGYPEKESFQVRQAIFSGASLPDTLTKLGVSKAAHRQSLRTFVRSTEQVPGLSDRLLSGGEWLNAMRIAGTLSLRKREDWQEFFRLEPRVSCLGLQRVETVSKILHWCLLPGYTEGCRRFELLAAQARAFVTAAGGLAGMDVVLDDAILLAMGLVEKPTGRLLCDIALGNILDPKNIGQLVAAVSQLSGKSADQLMRRIFDAYPKIPKEFQIPEPFTIIPLDRVDLAEVHGTECNICLQSAVTVIQYVACGVASYGVRSRGAVAGTIALALDNGRDGLRVQNCGVTAVNNSEPSPALRDLACSLAGSWDTEAKLTCWVAYADQCAQWLQSIGA